MKILVTYKSKTEFIDSSVLPYKTYQYYIVPYYKFNGNINFGDEIMLKKIKYINKNYDDWWKEEGLE